MKKTAAKSVVRPRLASAATAKKSAAKKSSVKKAATKKAAVKKTSAKKVAGKAVKKAAVKKTAAKTAKPAGKTAKKSVAKKSVVKKNAAPKTTTKKPTTQKPVAPKNTRRSKPVAAATPPPAPRFTIEAADTGRRIDRFLGERLENASRTRIQKWMEDGAVRVNGEPARKSRSLEAGDVVEVTLPVELPVGRVEPEDIPLNVVYEDRYLAVVDKPKGLVTHPGHGVAGGTLANALAYRFRSLSNFGGDDRPGIVHRLDRDTSGLLVVARDNATHAALSAQLAAREISRTYRAIVWREPPREGTFDWPLGRHPKDPVKRAVVLPDPRNPRALPGKSAVTHYRVIAWYQFAAELEVKLETGRTHQIRVHLSHAGYPVAGDTVYGGDAPMLGRVSPLFQAPAAGLLKRLSSQALHAARLSFVHPRTGKTMSFESPLPAEFESARKWLEAFRREDDE